MSHNIRVLMTTPSLDIAHNVSGIASVADGIRRAASAPNSGLQRDIVLCIIGKRDSRRRNFAWILSQIGVPLHFLVSLLRSRPGIIHINGSLNTLAILRDHVLLRLARLSRLPIIYHIHGGAYLHQLPANACFAKIIANSLRLSDGILVLGPREAESLKSLYQANPARIRELPNSVEIPPNARSHDTSGRLRVISIGRLSPEKGLGVLCDACEQDSQLRGKIDLQLYGAGPLEEAVVPRLKASLGKNFRFNGVAGPEEKKKAYARAEVVVMPSLQGEGLPMVLLEAMAAGLVPIATADGSVRDLVTHGETGLIIAKNDHAALASALKILVDRKETSSLASISERARLHIAQNHSAFVYAKKLEAYYCEFGS